MKLLSIGLLLLSTAAFAGNSQDALPLHEGGAELGLAQEYKTVCLWNDTDSAIRFEVRFQYFDPYETTLPANSWFSYSYVLRRPDSEVPPLTIRFQREPGQEDIDIGEEEMLLEPQNTGTIRNCSRLRGINLHYEFKIVRDPEVGNHFELRGPTQDP